MNLLLDDRALQCNLVCARTFPIRDFLKTREVAEIGRAVRYQLVSGMVRLELEARFRVFVSRPKIRFPRNPRLRGRRLGSRTGGVALERRRGTGATTRREVRRGGQSHTVRETAFYGGVTRWDAGKGSVMCRHLVC
jgi:hypothetical protein